MVKGVEVVGGQLAQGQRILGGQRVVLLIVWVVVVV